MENDEFKIVPTKTLGSDWKWKKYDDGSGSLVSPNGNEYMIYDLETREFKFDKNSNWDLMTNPYEPISDEEFFLKAEEIIKKNKIYTIEKYSKDYNYGFILTDLCRKYKFEARFSGENDNFYCEVYANNIDRKSVLWFDIQLSNHDSIENGEFVPKIKIYGNTDQNNIWLCDTRKDLSKEDIIDFCEQVARLCDCKLVSSSTNKDDEIYIHNMVDLEDLQEMNSKSNLEELFKNLEERNKLVYKLMVNDFNIWKTFLIEDNNFNSDKYLLDEIKSNFRKGSIGIENELDNIRVAYDKKNNTDLHFEDIDNLWDCFNWYKDFLEGSMEQKSFKKLIDYYMYDFDFNFDKKNEMEVR